MSIRLDVQTYIYLNIYPSRHIDARPSGGVYV
ncbi:hypothetical protein VPHD164_0059 [Vibrio phage D164]